MKSLTFQIHYAALQAEALAVTLSDRAYAELEEDLDASVKMHVRIDKTLKMLEEPDKETVNRLGETSTSFMRRNEAIEVPVKAISGLLNMPNIYLHISMACAILRKEGVRGRGTGAAALSVTSTLPMPIRCLRKVSIRRNPPGTKDCRFWKS